MPVIAIRDDAPPDDAVLAEALGRLVPGAPVVVMIHGYRYSPTSPSSDPHRHILALVPDGRHWGAVSWPRRLGLGGGGGLALAWGWDASGSIWRAHRRALASGEVLARLLARLRAMEPDRPVHLIAHSLGARVALAALTRLRSGDVRRVILLAAALSLREAQAACVAPAGRGAEIINVVGRENHPFDLLLRLALPHHGERLRPDRIEASSWLDLPLDDARVLGRLDRMGWPIAQARARICHWSSYLRPGVWALYRALLSRPDETPLAALRDGLGRESAARPAVAP